MLISKDGTTAGLTQLFKRWLTPALFDPAFRHDHNELRMYRFASMRDIRVHLACNVLKDPDYFSQPPREMSDSTTANTRISENLRPRAHRNRLVLGRFRRTASPAERCAPRPSPLCLGSSQSPMWS